MGSGRIFRQALVSMPAESRGVNSLVRGMPAFNEFGAVVSQLQEGAASQLLKCPI